MAWTAGSERPAYCPRCGDALGTRDRGHDEAALPHCEACDLTLYRNPVPMARATVVDGDAALLIQRGVEADQGRWALPGGRIERHERPAAAAARELREEAGLSVAPEDLVLIGDGQLSFETGESMVSFNYAAPAAAAEGAVEPGDEPRDARFWTREELRADPPLLRASGLDQVLSAVDAHGDAG